LAHEKALSMFQPSRSSWPLAVGLCLVLAGCGGSSLIPVSGTVLVDGKPLTGAAGAVMFVPVKGGTSAAGSLQKDGTFKLATGAAPGLAPGEYQVGVTAMTPTVPKPGSSEPEEIPKPLILPRYADPNSSGLKFTIRSAESLDIKLESK